MPFAPLAGSTLTDPCVPPHCLHRYYAGASSARTVTQDAPSAERAEHALKVVEKCRTSDGFRASAHLYPELWLRDLVFSEEVLLGLGHAPTVRRHFESFLRYQRDDGQLPTVITSGWRRVLNQRFHFWTSDTEILFLIGAMKYVRYSGDKGFLDAHHGQLVRCRSFVMSRRNQSGLIPGGDWRDAVPNFRNRCLLSNQVLLVDMYTLLGLKEEAEAAKQKVREVFLSPGQECFANSVLVSDGSFLRDSYVDCFGSSLAILNGTAQGRTASSVAGFLRDVRSPYGFRNMFPPLEVDRAAAFKSPDGMNAFARNGAFLRNRKNRYQNSAVWPFVEARIASAFRMLGMENESRCASDMIAGRPGFFEWYSPLTGRGEGSRDQLWTAAAVIAQTRK